MRLIITERSFGVEIEVNHFSYGFFLPIDSGVMPPYRLPDEMLRAFHEAGLRLGREEDSWRFVEDHSIIGGRGIEFQSPHLQGEDGVRQVGEALKILAAFGAEVNGSCGFHVHHHAGDLGARELMTLLRLVATWEPRIYGAIPGNEKRMKKTCKPLSSGLVQKLQNGGAISLDYLEKAWYGNSDASNREVRYHESRYHGLNLHSYWFRKTVEFRYMKGTLKGEVAKQWILFTHALVEGAKKGLEHAPWLERYFQEWLRSLALLDP